jgi:cytochrome P450
MPKLPGEFKPERFLPENANAIHAAPYFPFGAGQQVHRP